MLSEALKSLSFITSIPLASRIGPLSLYKELTRKDAHVDINTYKYFLFDLIVDSMLSIYKYDLSVVPSEAYVHNKVYNCLDQFKHFEETKMILEEFAYMDLSTFEFIKDDIEILILESYVLREMEIFKRTGETIYVGVTSTAQMVRKKIKPTKHYPQKVSMLYCISLLMELVTHGALLRLNDSDFRESIFMMGSVMKRFGFGESLQDARKSMQSI
ncbi:MAG: hypothetical protein COA44_15860 [Arcobacter sp.]|nr:MAG: hypothetical protein COA44_15860 [Arcobacter sp.]